MPPNFLARGHNKMAAKQGRPRKSPENLFGRGVAINDQARSVRSYRRRANQKEHFRRPLKQQESPKPKGAFQKTIEATGVPSTSLARIIEEADKDKCDSDSPPKKRYKLLFNASTSVYLLTEVYIVSL